MSISFQIAAKEQNTEPSSFLKFVTHLYISLFSSLHRNLKHR